MSRPLSSPADRRALRWAILVALGTIIALAPVATALLVMFK